jgi:hypothetical protein
VSASISAAIFFRDAGAEADCYCPCCGAGVHTEVGAEGVREVERQWAGGDDVDEGGVAHLASDLLHEEARFRGTVRGGDNDDGKVAVRVLEDGRETLHVIGGVEAVNSLLHRDHDRPMRAENGSWEFWCRVVAGAGIGDP